MPEPEEIWKLLGEIEAFHDQQKGNVEEIWKTSHVHYRMW